MHEMTFAKNILDIANETLKQNNLSKINYIEIDCGKFTNIMVESLMNCFKNLTDIKIIINDIPIKIECNQCHHQYLIDHQSELFKPCKFCGSRSSKTIISGNKTIIKKIDAE